MKKIFLILAAIVLLSLCGIAQADVLNLGPGLTNLETVTVGDPGNAADTRSGWGSRGFGSVNYAYSIGKYEVTTGQYVAFLNAVAKVDTFGLYSTKMDTTVNLHGCNIRRTGTSGSYVYTVGSGSQSDLTNRANRPVNFVSYWDSCRFANWLDNGQPTGTQNAATTEQGAYILDGYIGTDGHNIQRTAGATWAITGEDEWYKAAFYKGGSTSAGYWLYPTKSDKAPANQVLTTDPGNSANYYISNYSIGSPYERTNVGEFENSASACGSFDQGGNVWEWNEATPFDNYLYRGQRGGSLESSGDYPLKASSRSYGGFPAEEVSQWGFRVAYFENGWQPVPEPSSLIALAGGLAGLLGIRRRRA